MLSPALGLMLVSVITTEVLGIECGLDIHLPENACCAGGSVSLTTVPGGKIVNSCNCNPFYSVLELTMRPEFVYPDAQWDKTYMLMFLDKDSPFKSPSDNTRYVCHYIIANIPGCDLRYGNFNRSTVISEYLSPTPLFNELFHHYQVYMFYYQDCHARTYTNVLTPAQLLFDFSEYLRRLEDEGVVLCGPVSGVQLRLSFGNIVQIPEVLDSLGSLGSIVSLLAG